MSKVINRGYTDTATTATQLDRRGLNFGADFRVQKDNGPQLELVNITGPLDRSETIYYNVTPIANVYDKSGIDASAFAPNKRGVNIYVRLADIYQVTDSTDAAFLQQLPLSASLTIRIPQSEFITTGDVETLVAGLVSALYETGSETQTRLSSILRGSLKPSDL